VTVTSSRFVSSGMLRQADWHIYVEFYGTELTPPSSPDSLKIPYRKQLCYQGEFSHSKVLIFTASHCNFLCFLYRASSCALLPTLEFCDCVAFLLLPEHNLIR